MIEACKKRSDNWVAEVRLRLDGAVSEIHAADARYHVDCKSKILSPKSVASATKSVSNNEDSDEALDNLLHIMMQEKSRIWNSVDLCQTYKSGGGCILSK